MADDDANIELTISEAESESITPKWQTELEKFSDLRTCFILEGNVFDNQLTQYYSNKKNQKWKDLSLIEVLTSFFVTKGYKNIFEFDNVSGFTCSYGDSSDFQRFFELSKSDVIKTPSKNKERKYFRSRLGENADEVLRLQHDIDAVSRAVIESSVPSVFILNHASRYLPCPTSLDYYETAMFEKLYIASRNAAKNGLQDASGRFLRNIIVIVTNKINDLPTWFFLDNAQVKILNLQKPSKEFRILYFKNSFDRLYGTKNDPIYQDEEVREKYIKKIADATEGFSNKQLNELCTVSLTHQIPPPKIDQAVLFVKHGLKNDPWKNPSLISNLAGLESEIKQKIFGQDSCVKKACDIVIKAASPVSGLLDGAISNKPKGILFLAGPTGTGKTDLVKRIVMKIFGNERNLIRFDMSEYQSSHSDQKLLGAPPGYVGYEEGGQLTNAVKNNPFSIILFDEIEKADPTIFDKFLQILDDGRMTDGKGETVYFNDCIIVFTSNLGMYAEVDGKKKLVVPYSTPYEDIIKIVRQGITHHFTMVLQRPEILNRIGENFAIFDFIRPDVAKEIYKTNMKSLIEKAYMDEGLTIVFPEAVSNQLMNVICDTSDPFNNRLVNGGRGVRNAIDRLFLTPLSVLIFEQQVAKKLEKVSKVTIKGIKFVSDDLAVLEGDVV